MRKIELIEKVLREQPETRNSDRKLRVAVWEAQLGCPIPPRLREFLLDKAIDPETIRRHRAKLQEGGKYPASEKVAEARHQKGIEHQVYHGSQAKYAYVINPISGQKIPYEDM